MSRRNNPLKKSFLCFALLALSIFSFPASGVTVQDFRGKRVLYVNSYHPGYAWSDGEQRGAEMVLRRAGVSLEVVYLDTKTDPSEEFGKKAALRTKKIIEEFKPDVLIVADDPAFVYLVMPYYRDAALPVVFCGINWDVGIYQGPYRNTTGMIETGLIGQLYGQLRKFAKGDKVAVLSFDAPYERKNTDYYDRYIKPEFLQKIFVKDFASWKKEFLNAQVNSDMLILSSPDGIQNWDKNQALDLVDDSARIPIGTDMLYLAPLALIGLVKNPQEQGEYAANAALRILSGQKPADIPVASNKKGDLFLNLRIAGKLNIVFTPSMLKTAKDIITADQDR